MPLTIQGLLKLTHEMFTSLVHEPLRLLHVNLLFKLAIEKCGFHIHLMDLHVSKAANARIQQIDVNFPTGTKVSL